MKIGCVNCLYLPTYLCAAGSIPAAELALDYINSNTTILPGYYLKLEIYDDGVSVPQQT